MCVCVGDALAKLAAMAAPRCRVIRDGKKTDIDAKECVPGDIVLIGTGDQVTHTHTHTHTQRERERE